MTSNSISLLLTIALFTIGCADREESDPRSASNESVDTSTPEEEVAHPVYLAALLDAHKVNLFNRQETISFDITLRFGGKERLNGSYTARTNSTRVILKRKDGATALFDDEKVYLWPADADWGRVRFDLLTWYYFMVLPFKMSDPGTSTEEIPLAFSSADPTEKIIRLTFGENVGDAPEDWYLIRRSDSSGLIDAVAYIVTFSKTAEEASEDPHAIAYHDYRLIDGVPIPHRWTFHTWREGEGITGELGVAEISNVRFGESDKIEAPEGAIEIGLP